MTNNHWLKLTSKEKQSEKARFNKIWDKILKGGGGSSGSADYNDLDESTLPQIEDRIVKGNKQATDYNLMSLTRLKAIVNGTDTEVKIKSFNGESIFQKGSEPSHMLKVPYVIIQRESDLPPFPYKVGDLLVSIRNNIVQDFKICIKNSADVYEAGDWLNIGNNNVIPVRKQYSNRDFEPAFENTKNTSNSDDGEPVLMSTPPTNTLKAEEEPEYTNNYDEFILIDGKYEKIGIDKYDDLQESSIPSIEGVKVKGAKNASDYNLISLTNMETVLNTIKELINTKQDILVDTGSSRNLVQLNINGTNYSLLGSDDIVITTGESTVVNADWNEADESKAGYIKNKPLERLNIIESYIDNLETDKQDKLVDGENISTLTINGTKHKLTKESDISFNTGGSGGISTYAEAPDKPEIEGHVLNAGNNTYESLNIAKNTDMQECKSQINAVETTIGGLGVRIDADENDIDKLSTDIDNINDKICTDFFKTSTIKSPSCKAIADYIDSVLAELDGSEEAF